MKTIQTLFLTLVMLSFSTIAKADVTHEHVTLQCDMSSNQAVIRFAMTWNDDKLESLPLLPNNRSKKWDQHSYAKHNTCILGNGKEIKVQHVSDQAFAYGAGGASPSQRVNVWVDGRKMLSKLVFLKGYGDTHKKDLKNLNSIFIAAKDPVTEFEICGYPDKKSVFTLIDITSTPIDKTALAKEITCKKKNIQNNTIAPDLQSQTTQEDLKMKGKITFAATYRPSFCKEFIISEEKRDALRKEYYEKKIGGLFSYNPWHSSRYKEFISLSHIDGVKLFPKWHMVQDDHRYRTDHYIRFIWQYMDFDNDGRKDTVLNIESTTHAFDGNFFLVKKSDIATKQDIIELDKGNDTDPYTILRAAESEGWHSYSASGNIYNRVRYTTFKLFTIKGQTYLLSYPKSKDKIPLSVISRPKKRELEPVCIFQAISTGAAY